MILCFTVYLSQLPIYSERRFSIYQRIPCYHKGQDAVLCYIMLPSLLLRLLASLYPPMAAYQSLISNSTQTRCRVSKISPRILCNMKTVNRRYLCIYSGAYSKLHKYVHLCSLDPSSKFVLYRDTKLSYPGN